MTPEKAIVEEARGFLKQSEEGLRELEELKKEKEFVLNEWKTNPRWFREEPGHVTTVDVIKTCIEHAWAARGQYEYEKRKRQEEQA